MQNDDYLSHMQAAKERDEQYAKNLEGPDHLCPQPAPGLILDSRGVLVRQSDDDGSDSALREMKP